MQPAGRHVNFSSNLCAEVLRYLHLHQTLLFCVIGGGDSKKKLRSRCKTGAAKEHGVKCWLQGSRRRLRVNLLWSLQSRFLEKMFCPGRIAGRHRKLLVQLEEKYHAANNTLGNNSLWGHSRLCGFYIFFFQTEIGNGNNCGRLLVYYVKNLVLNSWCEMGSVLPDAFIYL